MPETTKNAHDDQTNTTRKDGARQPESLDGARSRFARLLRSRIAEAERVLTALRTELAAVTAGTTAGTKRTTTCATCGKKGHTRRGCPQRAAVKPEKPAKNAATASVLA